MIADQLHVFDVIIRNGKTLHVEAVQHWPNDGTVEIWVKEQQQSIVLKRNEPITKGGDRLKKSVP